MVIRFEMDIAALVAGLDELAARGQAAAMLGAQAAAAVAEVSIKRQLSMYSHTKRTPTPSPEGAPPAAISGTLRRSVIKETGAGYVDVGPSVVYARIQELGGQTGRRGATRLPARPYVEPGYNSALPAMETAALAAIRYALGL
jgi:phage gpG-like protein